jgi:outer membrane protein OmpA-like peptidoglycan-associated protein
MTYLIENGIDPKRLESKGFGASQPIVTDREISSFTSETQKENAHQTNRRTEYKILK